MRRDGCEYCIMKWQSVLTAKDVDITFLPFNQRNIKTLRLNKKMSAYEYGVTVTMRPTQEDKQLMLGYLITLRDKQVAQGGGGINAADFFVIEEMIRTNDLKKAQLYLGIAIRKQEKKDMEQKMMMMKQQEQVQIETAKATKQGEAELEELKAQLEMQKLQMEHQQKKEILEIEKQNNLELMLYKVQADTGRDLVSASSKDAGGREATGGGASNIERGIAVR